MTLRVCRCVPKKGTAHCAFLFDDDVAGLLETITRTDSLYGTLTFSHCTLFLGTSFVRSTSCFLTRSRQTFNTGGLPS